MNNKLFARIAAAAVGVSMLSTFVFADGTASLNADKSQLTLNTTAITSATGEDATQVTMMAYLVGADATIETPYADETTTPMVALEQVAKGDVATSLATINVLAEKFANTSFTQAIIKTGHNGTVSDTTGGVKWLIGTVSTPEGKKITIMNGATAEELTVDNEGNITLPKTAVFDKNVIDGFNFTLYSWVAIADDDTDNKVVAEYVVANASENVKVAATDLEGKTLYAKFDTGRKIGDVDGNGKVAPNDYKELKLGILNNVNYKYVKDAIYTSEDNTIIGRKVGDVDGNGKVAPNDYKELKLGILNNVNYKYVKEQLYIINKNK